MLSHVCFSCMLMELTVDGPQTSDSLLPRHDVSSCLLHRISQNRPFFLNKSHQKLCGAGEARRAHNPEALRSKRSRANFQFFAALVVHRLPGSVFTNYYQFSHLPPFSARSLVAKCVLASCSLVGKLCLFKPSWNMWAGQSFWPLLHDFSIGQILW